MDFLLNLPFYSKTKMISEEKVLKNMDVNYTKSNRIYPP